MVKGALKTRAVTSWGAQNILCEGAECKGKQNKKKASLGGEEKVRNLRKSKAQFMRREKPKGEITCLERKQWNVKRQEGKGQEGVYHTWERSPNGSGKCLRKCGEKAEKGN